MRPIRVEGPTIFLTEGPKDAVEPSEQPLLVVAAAPGGPAELAQRDNFARTLFGGTGSFKEVRIISTDIIRLNAMQTHQILAEGKDAKTGADIKIVQWVRFGNGAFLRFLGVANNDAWSEAFTKFRAVRDGVATKSTATPKPATFPPQLRPVRSSVRPSRRRQSPAAKCGPRS